MVLRTDPGGPDFLIELNMLIATLEHHAGEEERVMFPQSHALGEAALESLLVVGADHHATARPRSWARIRGRGQRRSGSQPAATDGVSQGAGEADAQVALRPGPARLTCSSAAFSGIATGPGFPGFTGPVPRSDHLIAFGQTGCPDPGSVAWKTAMSRGSLRHGTR